MLAMFFIKAKNKLIVLERRLFLWSKRVRLKNKAPTIISNNCVGGVIYHDLGLRFSSPTINLFFSAEDYIKFVEDLPYYLAQEVKEEKTSLPYPVGHLGDIRLYFMHYKSFDEAKRKWDVRAKRVDLDDLFFIMSEKEGCTLPLMERFDRLAYPNKVLLTHIPMPNIRCAHYIPGFEHDQELGIVTDMRKSFLQRRYIDAFDYVRFFNKGSVN